MTPTHRHILRTIAALGPTTRKDLAADLGLSKAAMSGLTRDLLDKGMLLETTTSLQGQGRPSVLLDLRPEGAYFVGISLMSDPARLALVDLQGRIAAQAEIPRAADPEVFAQAALREIPRLIRKAKIAPALVAGLGVALSGLVDREQAICVKSTLLGWEDAPLARWLQEGSGLPCFLENDAKSLALNEKHFGQARDLRSFSLVWLGEGIGAAHFIDDRLHRGAHGGAGEIAHCTAELDGPPCRCGKRGCLDAVASLTALLDQARAEGLGAASLEEIEAAAAAGSSAAIRMLHRAGGALGLILAQLVQINDPQRILILHREKAFDGLFATVLRQTLEANVLPRLSGQTPLTLRRVEEDVWLRAAASVAAHPFLHGLI